MDYEYIKKNATYFGECGINVCWYYFENTLYVEAEAEDCDVYPFDLWSGDNFVILEDIEKAIFGEGCVLIDFSIFDRCDRLVQINLPASFARACPHFTPEDCGPGDPLWYVEPGNDETDTINLFSSESLQRIHVAEGNPYFSSEDGVLFDKEKKTLLCFPCGRMGTYIVPRCVRIIGEDAFSGCDQLEDLIIPDSVMCIGDEAFKGCSGFDGNLVIPNGVEKIGVENSEEF